ncbi:hypothetical protein NQ043_10600 [Staphylococcus hyicus]|uniref:hypothetical protein n=1 Tax=Staphylococcus hyicus TaxID=1284 RepID=UPI00211BB9BB|nr:hypothetical protein [Staphylococcus hyicus]MCQ9301571.1 hypothetical protein [Staphylococcus hyicus]
MKKWILIVMTLVLVSACGNDQQSAQPSHKDEKSATHKHDSADTSQKASKDNQASTSNKTQTTTHEDDVAKLPDQMKAALVFSSPEATAFTLSKEEILTGVFEQDYLNKPQKKQLYKLYLIESKGYTNGPDDMKFYSVYPPKKGFNTVMGIGKHKAFIGGTQSPGTYQQLLETGKELDLDTLYAQNKQLKSLTELSQKVEFANKNPMENEATRKDFEEKENPATMAHARSQVYEMINKFEGKPINTKDYIWDNVRWDNGLTGWTVNYRNHNLEIVGTYKQVEGQPLIKLDANGQKIK